MPGTTPQQTMQQLIAAFNAGHVDEAMSLYEPDATFVAEPTRWAGGAAAIRSALVGFFATMPTVTIQRQRTIEAGDVALHCTRWSLTLDAPKAGPSASTGHGIVVLRRQPDRTWLVAVENPWGSDIVQ